MSDGVALRGLCCQARFLFLLCDLASDTMHRRLGWGAKYWIGKASSPFLSKYGFSVLK